MTESETETETETTSMSTTPTKRKGHAVRGALTGVIFGGFLTLFLLTTGVLPLDSLLVLLLPVLLLIVGIALGATTPLRRSRSR